MIKMKNRIPKLHFAWIVVIIFAIVYLCSLTIYYIEGDDAATAAYHVMGRNATLQKPYEPYHSGYDFLLSFLPANEPVIRYTMMLSSALAQPIMVISLLILIFRWLQVPANSLKAGFISLILMLSIPELFFMGLYYNPTSVAMMLLVLAHLILRPYFETKSAAHWRLPVAMLLFAFGATLRWNTAVYGLVIVLDLLINMRLDKKRIYLILGWGFFALLFFFVFLKVEGVGYKEIRYAIQFEGQVSKTIVRSLSEKILINTPFFTPSLIFLFATGLFAALKKFKHNKLFLLFALVCFVTNYLIVSSLFYKVLAPVYVLIFYFAAAGILFLIEKAGPLLKPAMLILILLASTPWLLGIKIANARVWGPGFVLKEKYYSLENLKHENKKELTGYKYSIAFFDGTGFAHPEGPRPIWGYGGVLLGGKWRELYKQDEAEYLNMFSIAKSKGYPLVKISFNYNIENILYANGYSTLQSYNNKIKPNIYIRTFTNSSNDTVLIYRIESENIKTNEVLYHTITSMFNHQTIMLYGEYYGKPVLIGDN